MKWGIKTALIIIFLLGAAFLVGYMVYIGGKV